MIRKDLLSLAALMLGGVSGCQDENPYWNSSQWNLEATARQLSILVQAQTRILQQAQAGTPLTQPQQRTLWALMLDEYDTGFEIYVRLNRTPDLIDPFCQILHARLSQLDATRVATLTRLGSRARAVLQLAAPSPDAFRSMEPRIERYSVTAMLKRCGHPNGFDDWSMPSQGSQR